MSPEWRGVVGRRMAVVCTRCNGDVLCVQLPAWTPDCTCGNPIAAGFDKCSVCMGDKYIPMCYPCALQYLYPHHDNPAEVPSGAGPQELAKVKRELEVRPRTAEVLELAELKRELVLWQNAAIHLFPFAARGFSDLFWGRNSGCVWARAFYSGQNRGGRTTADGPGGR